MMIHTLDTTVAPTAMTNSGLFDVVTMLAECCLMTEVCVFELFMLRVRNGVLDLVLVLFCWVFGVGLAKL